MPTTPQKDAGSRMDPPPSLPSDRGVRPAAMAAAGSSWGLGEVPRVTGEAVERVVRVTARAELGVVGLADDDGARGLEACGGDGVDGVRALQRDGRAPYEALAQEVGLARSTTRGRVQRLLDDGGLRIIGAVHPAVYGLDAFADVAIEIDGPVQPVADQLTALPQTSFVTTTTGRFALGAELRTADTDALAEGIDRIQAINGVRTVQTVIYQRIWKDPYFPPGNLTSVEVDDADHALLNHLRVDGRASFAELAGVTGLSPGATRVRVLRLLSSGIVHVGALVRLDAVSQAHTVGTVRLSTYDEVHAALEEVRAVEGVRVLETWAHLNFLKEEHDRGATSTRALLGRSAGLA